MNAPARRHPLARMIAIRVAVALGIVLALAAGAFFVWASTPLGPTDAALSALRSGDGVTVETREWGLLFNPDAESPSTGLVFYPGGRVDFRSYAPLAREVASRGYAVAIVRVPLSLAILAPDAAAAPIGEVDGVSSWVVAGHSLGGVAAATFSATHDVQGLALLASYPQEDLSGSGLAVIDVTAGHDEVLDRAAWSEAAVRLPRDTESAVIEGGNHAGFGDYGPQPGDGEASIGPDVQRVLTADALVKLLERVSGAR